jgi:hypothetical protein
MTEKTRLARKDWISIAFSTAALLLSAASFYFGNLRVSDSLQARVVQMEVGQLDDDIRRFMADSTGTALMPRTYVTVNVAFLNLGNRQALISGFSYAARSQEGTTGHYFGGQSEGLPIVMDPKAIKLVGLRIPLNLLLETDSTLATSGKYSIALRFEAVDSRGTSHASKESWIGSLTLTPNGGSVPRVDSWEFVTSGSPIRVF